MTPLNGALISTPNADYRVSGQIVVQP